MPHRLLTAVGLTIVLAAGQGCSDATPFAPARGLAGATSTSDASTQAAGLAADVTGTWRYNEQTKLVLPGLLAELLGLESEGAVLHMNCSSPDGVLELAQAGTAVTGTLVHATGTCRTKGGQLAPTPWALPYRATISGRIAGLTLHLDQLDDPPDPSGLVPCPKTGTIEVIQGVTVGLQTRGRCDLSVLGSRPAAASNSATATRP